MDISTIKESDITQMIEIGELAELKGTILLVFMALWLYHRSFPPFEETAAEWVGFRTGLSSATVIQDINSLEKLGYSSK
jgi:hypothetical protein